MCMFSAVLREWDVAVVATSEFTLIACQGSCRNLTAVAGLRPVDAERNLLWLGFEREIWG